MSPPSLPTLQAAAALLVLGLAGCAAGPRDKSLVIGLGAQRWVDDVSLGPGGASVDLTPISGFLEYRNLPRRGGPGYEFGVQLAQDEGSTSGTNAAGDPFQGRADLDTVEFYGGIHHAFRTTRRLRPYVGGGLTLIDASLFRGTRTTIGTGSPPVVFESLQIDETGLGLYLRGGVLYEVSRGIAIGLDLRVVRGGEISGGSGDDRLEFDLAYLQPSFVVSLTF